MDAKTQFDAEAYFGGLCSRNLLAREHSFCFCTCSGIEGLEGPLSRLRSENAFFCLDDTNDGSLIRTGGRGWVKNRTFTVFLLHRYKVGDMADRAAKLDLCRRLMRQIVSRLIIDEHDLSNEYIYINTSTVLSRELGADFLAGCTGLYFMVDCSEPLDVSYDPAEWQ